MTWILGVDGGASKTHALLSRADGTGRGFGVGGPSNLYDDPIGVCIERIRDAVDRARQESGLPVDESIDSATFSLCGADWEEDFVEFSAAIRSYGIARDFVVVNDAIGGLYAGLPIGAGVAVIIGTGVATAARGADGQEWHSSFWQSVSGANHLVDLAFHAIFQTDLGISAPTALTEALLAATKLPTPEALLHACTRRGSRDMFDRGRFAGVVLDVALSGDPVATDIVQRHATGIGEIAVAALRRVGLGPDDEIALVLGGGVLRHPSTAIPAGVESIVRGSFPRVCVRPLCDSPVVGAWRHAVARAHPCMSGELRPS